MPQTSTIDGGNGDDTIVGTAGNDVIAGGSGADNISGGAGNDVIDGRQRRRLRGRRPRPRRRPLGNGDDIFRWDPGEGSDDVDGGAGNDSLLFNGTPDERDHEPLSRRHAGRVLPHSGQRPDEPRRLSSNSTCTRSAARQRHRERH